MFNLSSCCCFFCACNVCSFPREEPRETVIASGKLHGGNWNLRQALETVDSTKLASCRRHPDRCSSTTDYCQAPHEVKQQGRRSHSTHLDINTSNLKLSYFSKHCSARASEATSCEYAPNEFAQTSHMTSPQVYSINWYHNIYLPQVLLGGGGRLHCRCSSAAAADFEGLGLGTYSLPGVQSITKLVLLIISNHNTFMTDSDSLTWKPD